MQNIPKHDEKTLPGIMKSLNSYYESTQSKILFKIQEEKDCRSLFKEWIVHTIQLIQIGFGDKPLIDEAWKQMNIFSTLKEGDPQDLIIDFVKLETGGYYIIDIKWRWALSKMQQTNLKKILKKFNTAGAKNVKITKKQCLKFYFTKISKTNFWILKISSLNLIYKKLTIIQSS